MDKEHYYLKPDYQTEWNEVSREQFIAAEQAAGFRSKFGPSHPATGGFSGRGMRGRVEYAAKEQPTTNTTPKGHTMNIERALELLEFYEGSEETETEDAERTVRLNAEDFNEILRCLREEKR